MDTLMGFRDYSSDTTRDPERDDPVTYISHEDTLILQDVIRNELKDEIKSKEMLDYFASYAWPLPVRPGQYVTPNDWMSWKLRVESFANLFLAHRFHEFDKKITKAMRENIRRYSY